MRSHSNKELKEWKKFDTIEQSKKCSSSSEVVSKALKKAFRDANNSAVIFNTLLVVKYNFHCLDLSDFRRS